MTKYIENSSRALTDYRSEAVINEMLKRQAGIQNSHAYRQYLQNNALYLINMNRSKAQNSAQMNLLFPLN